MKRKALVIGVNQYKDDIFCPEYSLKDAEDIAQLLRTFGRYDVQVLLNGIEKKKKTDNEGKEYEEIKKYEHQEIEDLISQLFNPEEEDTDTALLYFSGNGAGIYGTESVKAQKGDLLLTDFPDPLSEPSSQDGETKLRIISLKWLHDQLEKSPVKKQIVWLDSDFSDRFIKLFPESTDKQKYDRCFIAAKPGLAGYAEKSSTHGVLTEALLQCLNPVKQIKDSINSDILQKTLKEKFNWQDDLLKNTGESFFLTGRIGFPLSGRTREEVVSRSNLPKLRNDQVEGGDLLNIKNEAEALADMLLLRDLKPPLTVGILGEWGSGKSFVMHLMQQRMNDIRSASLTEEQAWGKEEKAFGYVGHVYQIKFDAWTYAKADLWYSLTQTIFDQFNHQYTLEKEIENLKKPPDLKESQVSDKPKFPFYSWLKHALFHKPVSENVLTGTEANNINRSQLEGGKFWQILSAMVTNQSKKIQK